MELPESHIKDSEINSYLKWEGGELYKDMFLFCINYLTFSFFLISNSSLGSEVKENEHHVFLTITSLHHHI